MAKTVLIVEDNELNMKLFHDLLEAHGYDTSDPQWDGSAGSGPRAPSRSHPDGHPAARSLRARSHQMAEGRPELNASP